MNLLHSHKKNLNRVRTRWKEIIKEDMWVRWTRKGFIFPNSLCCCFPLIKMREYLVNKWDYFTLKKYNVKVYVLGCLQQKLQKQIGLWGDMSRAEAGPTEFIAYSTWIHFCPPLSPVFHRFFKVMTGHIHHKRINMGGLM